MKVSDIRIRIADKLSTTEEEIELYNAGSTVPLQLDEEVGSFTLIEVSRKALYGAQRPLAAWQAKLKREAKEVRHVISASGEVTTVGLNSGRPLPGTTGSSNNSYPEVPLSEDEAIQRQAERVAQETGVDQAFRRPQHRAGAGAGGNNSNNNGAGPGGEFREPPPGYTCHNCGLAGHWIQHCPAAKNGNFNRSKVLMAPVGIPESMLERCSPDDPAPKFVTRAGILVKRRVDPTMIQHLTSSDSSAATLEVPEELKCPVCKKLCKDAVKLPCCDRTICDSCLTTNGGDGDDGPPLCPLCSEPLMIDDVVNDEEKRSLVLQFQRKRPREA